MKYKVFSIKGFLLVILLIASILYTLYSIPIVQAVDSSKSGVLAETKASTTSSSIVEKLNALKAEIASKAAKLKQEVNKRIENRAWIGVIKEKGATQITLTTMQGDRTVILNEYTIYQSKGKTATGSLKDFNVEDYIVAIGDVDDQNKLIAKKVIKTVRKTSNKKIFWGQVQSLTSGQINLKGVDGNLTVVPTSKTLYYLGNEEASIVDAKKDKFLVAVGTTPSSKESMAASMIYYIPSTGYFKPEKKVASPSGTTSPSATPKSTKKSS